MRGMEPTLRQNLIDLKDRYCGATGAAVSTVAQSACGHWQFFERLETGSSFTARIYDRAVRWFSDRWPHNAVWPDEIERPVRTPTPDAAQPAEASVG